MFFKQFSGKNDPDINEGSNETFADLSATAVNRGMQKTLKSLREATNLKFGMQSAKVSITFLIFTSLYVFE